MRLLIIAIVLLTLTVACSAQENLLFNGDFEIDANGDGAPEGWSVSEGKFGVLGEVTWITEGALEGQRSMRYVKTDPQKWYPQVWSQRIDVKPRWTYEMSALVQSDQPFTFRYMLIGEGGAKYHTTQEASDEPQRITVTFETGGGIDGVTIAFQMSEVAGTMIVDDVRLIATGASTRALLEGSVPDRFHSLRELTRRSGFTPWGQIGDGGSYPSERVDFRDTSTGAPTWKLSSGDGSDRHIYSNQLVWNADGSKMMMRSERAETGYYFLDADGGNIGGRINSTSYWSRTDPDIVFHRIVEDGTIAARNIATDETKVIWSVPEDLGGLGYTVWPVHPDGKKVFIVIGNQTTRVPRNWGYMVNTDGTGEPVRIDFPGVTHQVWFTKDDDYTLSYNLETRNTETYVDASYLVDGDGTNHRQVRDRHMSHRGYSPDGTRVAFHSGGVRLMNVDGTDEHTIWRGPGGHLAWEVDDDWLVATAGNIIWRIWTDGYATQICAPNTQLDYQTYECEAHLESSPDGTKIVYASDMLGNVDMYSVVMKPPDAPRNLTATVAGDTTRLTWEPGEHAREVGGYNVWASDASGGGYRLLTPTPVDATEATVEGAGPRFFVVTAVERSGLQGMPSAEANTAAADAPLRLWFEPEAGEMTRPMLQHFQTDCSGLYCATALQAEEGTPALALPVTVPRAGSYRLWACTRGVADEGAFEVSHGDALGELAARSPEWTWARGPALDLPAGESALTLTALAAGSAVDQLLLTTDPDFTPEGVAVTLRAAPADLPVPTGLTAEALSPYLVRLDWDAANASGLSHYNIYCSTDAAEAAGQEQIIASPVENFRFDWGLSPGTECTYRVTCVDGLGNESAPAQVLVKTPAGDTDMVAVAVTGSLLEGPVSLDFDAPAGGNYILWLRVASRDEARPKPVTVTLDGETVVSKWTLPMKYVTRGHGGPIKDTWLWVAVPLQTVRPRAVGLLQVGAHTVEIGQTTSADVAVDGAILTNDLSYLPEGITDYRGLSRLAE